MAVDVTLQFNGHNSYKLTDRLWCHPFGVQGMSYITHSFQAYADTAQAAAVRAKTKFIDADGLLLSVVDHSFAVTVLFEKVTITVPVPVDAAQAQLGFLGPDWWVAEPKSEQGQTATPYNVSYAGQLTYITPGGVYTGLIRADQIVVKGTLGNPTEELDERLITINSNAINLTSLVNNKTTKITNGGVYTGEIEADQITAGSINVDRIAAKSLTGAKLADGTVTGTNIAANTITGAKIAANTITADKINVTDLFSKNITASGSITGVKLYGSKISDSALSDFNMEVGSSKVSIDGSTYYYSALALFQFSDDTTPFFSIAGINREVYMQRKGGDNFLFTNHNGIFIRNNVVRSDLDLSNYGPAISYGSGSGFKGQIGIDEDGAYWTMGAAHSGQKTYFKDM